MFQTQICTTCFILGVVKWGKKEGAPRETNQVGMKTTLQ